MGVGRLKKHLYIGVLLGGIVLAGCSGNEESEEQVTKDVTNGQAVKVETSPDAEKVVSVTPLELTQEQREDYHKQYVEIVTKINAKEGTNHLEVVPIDEFNPEDWVEVKEFEKMVEDRANAKIIVLENTDIYSPNLVPKTAKLQIGSNVTTIIFNGSFETQLNSNTPDGRQLFSKFNSISSEVEGNEGSWIQTGYDSLLIDDGISYVISVGGKYSRSGVISSHNIEVEFHCDKNGGIN